MTSRPWHRVANLNVHRHCGPDKFSNLSYEAAVLRFGPLGVQPKTTVNGDKHRRCGRARFHPSPAVWSSEIHRPIGATNIVAVAWTFRDGRALITERREAKPTAMPRWAWIDHKPLVWTPYLIQPENALKGLQRLAGG